MKEHVIETKEIISSPRSSELGLDKDINEYLKLGWVIIANWVVDYDAPDRRLETIHFLLGWVDHSRKPVYPKK